MTVKIYDNYNSYSDNSTSTGSATQVTQSEPK